MWHVKIIQQGWWKVLYRAWVRSRRTHYYIVLKRRTISKWTKMTRRSPQFIDMLSIPLTSKCSLDYNHKNISKRHSNGFVIHNIRAQMHILIFHFLNLFLTFPLFNITFNKNYQNAYFIWTYDLNYTVKYKHSKAT